MTTENVQREMYRGDTYAFKTQLRNQDGAVFDLSPPNTKLWMVAKYAEAYPDSEAVFTLTSAVSEGITITDLARAEIRVEVPPMGTRHMPDARTKLVYSLRVRGPNNAITTVETGTLLVKPAAQHFTD